MRVPLVYHDGPIFGFDIGHKSIKLAQVTRHGKVIKVLGYGTCAFPPDTVIEGIIADPEIIAAAVRPVLTKLAAGRISAHKVAAALPVSKVFVRTIQLPAMSSTDLDQAVKLEAEQYVPVPLADLYLDYQVIEQVAGGEGKEAQVNILMVAAPRAIVDSYIQLFDLLSLEVDSLEVGLAAVTRVMLLGGGSDHGSLVVDFGSHSADMAVYDRVIRLTGTVAIGSDDLTTTLAAKLGITTDQANEIKFKFGIGPSGLQPKIVDALGLQLKAITAEIKKVIKYYEDRNAKDKAITQIILSGGGASMPGLVEYFNTQLKLPIVIGDPWEHMSLGHLSLPPTLAAPVYTTTLGLALREVEHD